MIISTFTSTATKFYIMIIKRMLSLSLLFVLLFSCKTESNNSAAYTSDTLKIAGHPAWIMQGNIYEVNVRQYTPEGTFNAFAKHLDRLKDMGVQTLWFMPVNPISKVDRKGALGSYYAASSYLTINPEFGTMEDWKNLVKECHNKGFKVIIDWVANHTGADHYWLTTHPDFYVKDSAGKPVSQFDWTDTRKLNFNNPELVDSMIADMKFWITESNIDGFRCDYAVGPSKDFWTKCISELKQQKNVFMLAEGNEPWLHEAGFDATYPWDVFNMMKLVAKGERPSTGLDSVLTHDDSIFPANAIRMYFTSNHDENSWNKADYGTMPGASHAPFAVFTQTIEHSVPEIYSGQEEPFLDSISFFYKDTITFGKYTRAPFYKTLLTLRKNNSALAANASYTKWKTNKDESIFAFQRSNGDNKVLVVLNFSNEPQTFNLVNANISGNVTEAFTNEKQALQNNQEFNLPAWGYKVYVY